MRTPDAAPAHSVSPVGVAIAGWTAFIVAGGVFFALAWNVAAQEPLVELDATVNEFLRDLRQPWMTYVMLFFTYLNSIAGSIVLAVAFGAYLAWKRYWYWLLTLALSVVGGMLLNVILKYAYERARPNLDEALVTLHTYSFPSGHTSGATVFYGVLAAYLVSRTRDPGARIAIVLGAVAMVAFVALSRVYLGAHFMSDVMAAAASSLAWLAVCLSGVHHLVRSRMGPS
jgi:membrane-associated phospholipid phosphatase